MGRVELHFTPTVVHSTLCVLESITQEEKEAILWKNLEGLLGI